MMENELFEKFRKGRLNNEERRALASYLKTLDDAELSSILDRYAVLFRENPVDDNTDYETLFEKIESDLNRTSGEPETKRGLLKKLKPFFKTASVAVAIILILTVSVVLLIKRDKQAVIAKAETGNKKNSDILPGGNNAILTLADGSSILLDTAQNGLLKANNGMVISKTENGQIVITANGDITSGKEAINDFNSISTPRGGQYQVLLADGTKVWLNAASSLRFPSAFKGSERNVTLTGEAYFEVAENKKMPFRVFVNEMRVEVLGTQFNIMSYSEEATINTTLLQGSIKVILDNEAKVLLPGQQARTGEHINVVNVNAAESIEWKNGLFIFEQETIQSIMRKLARWYDVDIEYSSNQITTEYFIGSVKRSSDIHDVLNTLSMTGLAHFKIEGRKIIVLP